MIDLPDPLRASLANGAVAMLGNLLTRPALLARVPVTETMEGGLVVWQGALLTATPRLFQLFPP